MAKRKKTSRKGMKTTSVGVLTSATVLNLIVNGLGLEGAIRSGSVSSGARILGDRVQLLTKPGTYQFNEYVIPATVSMVGAKVATWLRLNPGFTFGKGKKKYRIKLI